MSDDWDQDEWDEDWVDDYELDEEESAKCPECGAEMYIVTDKCNVCGYWLTESDRRAMWSGMSQSSGLKYAIKLVLVVILVALVSGFFLAL